MILIIGVIVMMKRWIKWWTRYRCNIDNKLKDKQKFTWENELHEEQLWQTFGERSWVFWQSLLRKTIVLSYHWITRLQHYILLVHCISSIIHYFTVFVEQYSTFKIKLVVVWFWTSGKSIIGYTVSWGGSVIDTIDK